MRLHQLMQWHHKPTIPFLYWLCWEISPIWGFTLGCRMQRGHRRSNLWRALMVGRRVRCRNSSTGATRWAVLDSGSSTAHSSTDSNPPPPPPAAAVVMFEMRGDSPRSASASLAARPAACGRAEFKKRGHSLHMTLVANSRIPCFYSARGIPGRQSRLLSTAERWTGRMWRTRQDS